MTNIEGSVALRAVDDSHPNDARACLRLVGAVILQALQDMDSGRKKLKELPDEPGEAPGEELDEGENDPRETDSKRLRDSARRWLLSEETRPWSFLWCCDVLDLRPSGIRSEMYTRRLYSLLRARVEAQKTTRRRQTMLNSGARDSKVATVAGSD